MMMRKAMLLWTIPFVFEILNPLTTATAALKSGTHTKNVAILVQSSRYYHNYRHSSNVLLLYRALLRHGHFRPEHVILMMAHDVPCEARNPMKNKILHDDNNLYTTCTEVNYRGEDVTVDNFLRVLLRRTDPTLDSDTNVLLYLTGHGGDSFFKFQDKEELTSSDMIHAFQQMKRLGRFNELLFVADTCQAFSLAPNNDDNNNNGTIDVENVYSIATSLIGQNSYAHHADVQLGVSVVDRYMHYFTEFMNAPPHHHHQSQSNNDRRRRRNRNKWNSMDEMSLKEGLVDSMKNVPLGADIGSRDLGCERRMEVVPMSDFFVQRQYTERTVELLSDRVSFPVDWNDETFVIPKDLDTDKSGVRRQCRSGDDETKNGSISSVERECNYDLEEEGIEKTLAEASNVVEYDNRMVDHHPTYQDGMNPSDGRFICAVLGSLTLVVFSNNYWWQTK